jgi:hypothetical protein
MGHDQTITHRRIVTPLLASVTAQSRQASRTEISGATRVVDPGSVAAGAYMVEKYSRCMAGV